MNNDIKILKVNISDIPHDDQFIRVGNKLVFSDNFKIEDLQFDFNDMLYPVQMNMTFVVLCLKGRASFMVNVDEKIVEKGMVATFLVDSFLQVKNVSDDFTCAVLGISPNYVDFSHSTLMPLTIMRKFMTSPFFSLPDEMMDECVDVLRMMKRQVVREDFMFKEEVARNYISVLICMAYQYFSDNEIDPFNKIRSRKDEIFDKFIAEVEEHYTMERKVSYYAEKIFISPKYLSSVVHDISGLYATDWIDRYVVMEAKTLLKLKDLPIKTVCNRLNFANQSFFSKYFKQHTGMTPRQYRDSL